MSDLYETLSAALAQGKARDVAGLYTDIRYSDAARMADAAVLIAVRDVPLAPTVILTQRPASMRDHPGQVAFPGGKMEAGESAEAAALREAEEEIGLARGAVRVIGSADLYHTGTGFRITPILAVIAADTPLSPDPHEVEAVFEAPLALLLNPAVWTEHEAVWQGQKRSYLSLGYEGFRIWGVTAAIIANLGKRLAWP